VYPTLAEAAATLPSELDHILPEGLEGSLLTLRYWQWLGLLVTILLGVTVEYVVRGVFRPVAVRVVRRFDGQADPEEVTRAVRPVGLVAAAMVWLLGIHVLRLPSPVDTVLLVAARLFLVLSAVWAAWRAVDMVASAASSRAQQTETKVDDVLIPLVRKTLKIFVIAIGVVYGAGALSINIVPLVTGLGIGGLAFAFAAKDTIENFFGSVAVILDRPFEVGDWVVIGSGGDATEGTVEELGFRSTRVRTFYNSQITIPNATLVRATVDNYGRRKYRRWKCHLGVQYDTTPDRLLAFTEGIRELVRTHPYTRKDYYQVWCHEFGDSSLNVLLYVFFEVPDWNTELRERERLFLDIVRLADRLGVSFAFPTQTVHLFKEQHPPKGQPHEPGHAPPQRMTDRRAMVTGIRAAQALIASQPWRDERPGPMTYDTAGPTPLDDESIDPDAAKLPDPAEATENTKPAGAARES